MLQTRRNNQNWLPEIFNDIFNNNWIEKSNPTAPAINVLETENSYELEVAAPGMNKQDFQINLDSNGDISINMEKKEEHKEDTKKYGHYLRREFSYGKYQQTMLLPEDADREKIEAKMENGVLSIHIPKMAKQQKEESNKIIEIK